jgi:hypothetical protein
MYVDYSLKRRVYVSIAGATRLTIYLQFISVDSLYMFHALFAHHQEVLYVQKLVYFCAEITLFKITYVHLLIYYYYYYFIYICI